MNPNLDVARKKIASLNLAPYATKAIMNGKLTVKDVSLAEKEYRHFLLLVFVNTSVQCTEWIVPTERADQIWHEHLLDSANYRKCCEDIFGKFIDHYPGLEKGSAASEKAIAHTKLVHESLGGGNAGFVPTVFAGCSANCASETGVHAPADAGHSAPVSGGGDAAAPASCGSAPSSCGGASCGGGGGGCGGGG